MMGALLVAGLVLGHALIHASYLAPAPAPKPRRPRVAVIGAWLDA
jgi:hypothetical protein